MKDFRELDVWHKAHQLTLRSYEMTRTFPRDELFGLTSQIRRCSASIGANIAEGCGRRGNGEFHRFLQTAAGSASELEYHFLLAHDLQYLDRQQYQDICADVIRVKKMLVSLARKVDSERHRGRMPSANC